jgi:hypothetical protein
MYWEYELSKWFQNKLSGFIDFAGYCMSNKARVKRIKQKRRNRR